MTKRHFLKILSAGLLAPFYPVEAQTLDAISGASRQAKKKKRKAKSQDGESSTPRQPEQDPKRSE